MNQVRENSKIPRRSPSGSDQLHVVAGTSTNVKSLSADEAKMLDHTQPRGTGPKGSSPEVAIYIGIPRQSNDLDDSDPPVENFEVFQYEEDDDDDDDEDVTFQLDEEGEESSKGGHHDGEDRGFKRGRRNQGGRFYRKRKKSGTYGNDVNYVPPYKKRFRRQTSVLPTKFLLGGNIRDPLNLASLADAKVNAELNAETPKSSPMPVPLHRRGEVPVFIPKNPDDPLGLQCETQNPHDFIAGIQNVSNAAKGRKRHRKRPHGRKRTDSECSVDKSEDSDGKGGDKDVSVSSEDDKRVKLDESGYESTNKMEKIEEVKNQVLKPTETKDVEQKPVIETKKEEEEQKKVEPEPGTSSGPPASKKRSRTRRKNKKLNVGPMSQLLSNIFNSRQTSDYVPLGTPSVHESNWYQFTPGRNSEYQYEYQAMPFESPLLADFSSDYGVDGSCAMEPFSPPPAPEHQSRRVVSEAAGSEDQVGGSMPAPIGTGHGEQDNTFLKPQAPPPFARHVKKRIRHRGNPIVSPVVPQPGCRRRMGHHGYHGHQHHHNPHLAVHHSSKQLPAATMTSQKTNSANRSKGKAGDGDNGNKYRRKDELFQYGNYNRYYGYRSAEGTEDNRLWAFSKDFFANKDVLDVGCNIGHITLTIARDYGAKMVTGVDIDPKLIEIAKKNVKHYVDRDPTDETIRFPHSCSLMYGMLQPPPANLKDTRSIPFPYNVSFRHENYVLDSDDSLNAVVPEYDVILCLSITKWVHLNNGDDGLKRFFRRSFLHLRPGGRLVLEPQPWSSYTKKKKLTETISCNYKAIRLYPDQFQDYLIKEVGYASVEKIHIPLHNSKGFQRPLMVFTKSEATDVKGSSSGLEMDTSVCAAASSTTSPIVTAAETVTSSTATVESSLPSPSECVVTTSGTHLSSP